MLHKFTLLLLTVLVATSSVKAAYQNPIRSSNYFTLIDGIYYSFSGGQAFVEPKAYHYVEEWDENHMEWSVFIDPANYSGDLVIPSTITYEGKEYTVAGVNTGAFSKCNLVNVVIPSTVKSLCGIFLEECRWAYEDSYTRTTIRKITFLNPEPPRFNFSVGNWYSGTGLNGITEDCVIVVPDGSKSAYQSATNGATYPSLDLNIIEASEVSNSSEDYYSFIVNGETIENGATIHTNNCFPGVIDNGELLFDASCSFLVMSHGSPADAMVEVLSPVSQSNSYYSADFSCELRYDEAISTTNHGAVQMRVYNTYNTSYYGENLEVRTQHGAVSKMKSEGKECAVTVLVYPMNDKANYAYFNIVFDLPEGEPKVEDGVISSGYSIWYDESKDKYYASNSENLEISILEDANDGKYEWPADHYYYPAIRKLCIKTHKLSYRNSKETRWSYIVIDAVKGPRGDADGDGVLTVGDIVKIQANILESEPK